MTKTINYRYFIFPIIVTILINCTEEPPRKGESLIGYWQALQKTSITVDGILGEPYEKGYYIRFLDNNCGSLYDQDENWTHDIKWAFQEREIEDVLYISESLNSMEESTVLSKNNIVNYIEKFGEMSFRTFAIDLDTIDGIRYNRGHRTFFVKQ